MTTIAWDGKTLAADKQTVLCGTKMNRTKLHWLADGSMIGLAGTSTVNDAFVAWLDGGAIGERPKIFDDMEHGPEAIQVMANGTAWLHSPFGRIRIEQRFAAVGSGAPYAMAALYMGRSAEEAVAIAIALDPESGGGVDTMSWGDF